MSDIFPKGTGCLFIAATLVLVALSAGAGALAVKLLAEDKEQEG